MMRIRELIPLCFAALSTLSPGAEVKPNLVLIYADDLGYGEVSAYNPARNKVPTPHIDKLAGQGMRFTDAHSSCSVCSPSRYTLLTGRYHWRSPLGPNIVGNWGKPAITPDRLTLGSLVRRHGYRTAMAGKWHLGWDWDIPADKRGLMNGSREKDIAATAEQKAYWNGLFSKDINGGPLDRGFDRYFGTDVPNWPPFVFIEDRRTVGIPGEFLPARFFMNKQASVQGPALADWSMEPILPAITDRACTWIGEFAKEDKPFFLYFPMTAPHTPISPNKEWQGRSGLGPYADFMLETDDAIGRVLAAIEAAGIADSTLVLLTSDNGNASYAGGKELEAEGHFPSGPLRGYKFDAWEGGHRVPFIVRWPGKIAAGSVCDELVHQADVFATVAEILGHELPANAGEDSFSLLPLFKDPGKPVRGHAVSQAPSGTMALRKGPWKIIFGPGGRTNKKAADAPGEKSAHLFNLADDLGETKDLHAEMPELVAELAALMDQLVNNGRSTPGEMRENDVKVNWRRPYQP
jgi:arylsulfatase A-like enzyme